MLENRVKLNKDSRNLELDRFLQTLNSYPTFFLEGVILTSNNEKFKILSALEILSIF